MRFYARAAALKAVLIVFLILLFAFSSAFLVVIFDTTRDIVRLVTCWSVHY